MNGDSPGYFTVTNGGWVHTIDNQGNVVEEFKCFTETEEGAVPLARLGTGCQAAITVSDSIYVFDINNFLHRYVKFDDTSEWRYQASWVLPSNLEIADGLVRGELLDSEKLWITTPSMSIVIELEEFSDGLTPIGDTSDPATILFELHMNSSMITSAQIGISPGSPS